MSSHRLDLNAIAAVFAKYPPTPGVKYSYGTSGFRADGGVLTSVACRMGTLMVLRCVVTNGPATGMMITASHNPYQDNGLKLVDASGDLLPQEWETYAETLANTPEATEAAAYLGELWDKFVKEVPAGARAPTVHIARDTRPTGVDMSEACTQSIQAVGATVRDFGLLTTPQLHFTVWRTYHGLPCTEGDYNDVAATSFRELYGAALPNPPTILVDCANGVGSLKLTSIVDKVKDLVAFRLVNTDTANITVLNEKCGADFVQKDLVFPTGVAADNVDPIHVVSLDGDADRIVYLRKDVSSGRVVVIDGDRILALLTMYVRQLVEDAGMLESTSFAVVQTAYANGGSTQYVRKSLGLEVVCAPTGVKYCHEAAKEGDVGVYFEANGHGTVIFSDAFLKRVRASESPAAQKILTVASLLSQVCGDAITDMLCVEVALKRFGWGVEQWVNLYPDLPSRQLKANVPNPQRIKTTFEQTRVLEPAALQVDIDAAVKEYAAPSRAFVRPSGTEPIVRIYAECPTREECDALANRVKAFVVQHLS